MTEPVLFAQEGGVVTLTLNEPATRNAMSPAIIESMVAHTQRINRDMSVCCVIVTGHGQGFSSGGNVKEMKERQGLFAGSPAEIRRGYWHGIQQIPMCMYELEVPSIAAVNGAAIGAGCDLSLMCDIRIAGRSAVFAESFMRVGLVSGDGGAWFLPRIVGLSKAYEMTFTGDFIDADEAARIGLVSKVVDDATLLDEANALARRIAAQPPHSLRLTKRLLRDSQQVALPIALEMASSAQALVQHTHDQHEAVVAFTEKRAPRFEGR
ncbi:MAG: crotonase/enoyl-CoA hydratase family protein [Comamonadaceae bacterium]|nr:MAG: crotonase/enoyl-CoA hydratase family protein [Comamonadaceae bacterium]